MANGLVELQDHVGNRGGGLKFDISLADSLGLQAEVACY